MSNHLADQTSPYLLQHANNPVDWYPWGDEALQRARADDRPICLSIGYSTCHWCHVMAHESFEDPATAELMNRLFINIKVDKEERPDIDRVYQTCYQVMQQRGGGWPLTVFLCPHTELPFFIATYIPDQPRHGMPAFRDVLKQVAAHYHDQHERLAGQQDSLREVLAQLESTTPAAHWDLDLAARACDDILRTFDRTCGGFGGAPKFPTPSPMQLLLRHGGDDGVDAVQHTLRQMVRGGIADQVGGGLFRYAVDARWEIPHFEKMLYVNGALLGLLAPFAANDAELRRAGLQVVAWLQREMRAPGGGFYAAIDADSDGGEGMFYLFDPAEADQVLADAPDARALLHAWFNLDRPANFEGRWHLHQRQSLDDAARAAGIPRERAAAIADDGRARLLAHRDRRARPATDNKIIASWNALAASGLFEFATAVDDHDIAQTGLDALDFIGGSLWDGERLWSTWQWDADGNGMPRQSGYLDDYAQVALALWQSLQIDWSNTRAHWLVALLERMIDAFADDAGGFFFTDRREPALILRDKEFLDNVTPAGNGVAALVLARAGHLFARPDWLRAAEATVRGGWDKLTNYPPGAATMLQAAAELEMPTTLVLLQGQEREQWHRQLAGAGDTGELQLFALDDAAPVPMAATGLTGTAGTVCTADRCRGPFTDLAALRQAALDDVQ